MIPDFELLRPIGRGGYGEVWLARGVTGILRAVKIVWRQRFPDATPFEREFRGLTEFAAISLEESIQLALLHIGKNDAAGFFYYVMELADDAVCGRTINPATYVPLTLAELRTRRGRLPAEECVRIGVELSRAMAVLHRHGLVHRDIKPSNVIMVGGVPKLADIGLVTLATDARTFIGTEGFIPPEGPGAATADVFALGKVLYELGTGLDRTEFPRLPEMARLADAHLLLRLNNVILQACDPEPRQRPHDGAALLHELEALQPGAVPRRRPGAFAAIAAGALMVVGAAIWTWEAGLWRASDSAPRTDLPPQPESATSIGVLAPRGTENQEANEAFVKGREFFDRRGMQREAEPLLQRAVELDPKFTAAWCALVELNSHRFGYQVDMRPTVREKAATALARARALAPDTPDVIRAIGIYECLVKDDLPSARRQFERLRALQPNDASVWYYLGIIDWADQRYSDAIAKSQRATKLDPTSRRYSRHLQGDYSKLRRWREKLAEQQRLSSLWPGALSEDGALGDQRRMADTKAILTGDISPLEELVARCAPEERETIPILEARMAIAVARHDLDEYRRLDHGVAIRPEDLTSPILSATEYFALGDAETGKERLRGIVAELHAKAAADPENANIWINVARVDAMLGNIAVAKAAIQRGVNLVPYRTERSGGAVFSRSLAVTYAWAGESEVAIEQLRRVVNHPDAQLSGHEMRTLSTFFPLRGHPRFEALANDPRNDAPLP